MKKPTSRARKSRPKTKQTRSRPTLSAKSAERVGHPQALGPGKPTKTATRRSRVAFPAISEEMKEWSAMLMADLNSWPHISTRKMFGFLFFYRKRVVFAALPLTRGFDAPSSLVLKFGAMPAKLLKRAQADERMHTSARLPAQGWLSFQVHSEADLRDALSWLNQAYEAAGS